MRHGIMLCHAFNEGWFQRWPKPVIMQHKINGDRCRAIIKVKKNKIPEVQLLSSQGNEKVSVPHIMEELAQAFESFNVRSGSSDVIELDGELYCHGMKHQDIRSIVSRTTSLHPDYKKINYHIFDVIELTSTQIARTKFLEDRIAPYLTPYDHLQVVYAELVFNMPEVSSFLSYSLNKGYEGIIFRHHNALYVRARSLGMMKLKSRIEGMFPITDCHEEIDKDGYRKGALGSLTLKTEEGEEFCVGTGPFLTRFRRETLWEDPAGLIGKNARIKFQEWTNRKVPYFPSLMEIV